MANINVSKKNIQKLKIYLKLIQDDIQHPNVKSNQNHANKTKS